MSKLKDIEKLLSHRCTERQKKLTLSKSVDGEDTVTFDILLTRA